MSFFWSTPSESKQKPSSPRPIPIPISKKQVDIIDVDDVIVDEQLPPITVPKSCRSEPTAEAFDHPPVTRRARPKLDPIEIPEPELKVKSSNGKIADECTPVHSAYSSPRIDVQFQPDPDPDECQITTTQFDVDECISRLEHAFHHDTKAFESILHQGIYKNTIVNGGNICCTPSIQQRLRDLQAKHLRLLRETSDLYSHLIQLL